jgi:hypothetical protein
MRARFHSQKLFASVDLRRQRLRAGSCSFGRGADMLRTSLVVLRHYQ